MNLNNLTQKEAFLQYLQKMDIEMLELILDDSITYFGASKKVFLKKLAFILNQVKLACEKSTLKIKKHRKKPNIYYLIMNGTYSNKFILEEKEGKITKLDNAKTQFSRDYIEELCLLDIFFGDDERVDFMPSVEYSNTLSRCIEAYKEIVNDSTLVLTKQDLINWSETHSSLFEEVKDQYSLFGFNPFKSLFLDFKNKIEVLNYYNDVINELNTYNRTYKKQWIANCDRELVWAVSLFEIDFIEVNLTSRTCKTLSYPNVSYYGEDFLAIVRFNNIINECDCGRDCKRNYQIIQ